MEWVSTVISIVQVVIIPLIASLTGVIMYIYKKTEGRITKVEDKLEKINPSDLEKISLIKDQTTTLNIEFLNFKDNIKLINDNLKSLETYLDKVSCNGIDECSRIFQSKENGLTPELLKSMLNESFAEFELKLFKEGYLTSKNNKGNNNGN